MGTRTTVESETVEYAVDNCTVCDNNVAVDTDLDTTEPKGINVLIGGGEHISVNKTSRAARIKQHRIPTVVLKWFGSDPSKDSFQAQYICPQCAKSMYGYDADNE
ncbi:MAG: hypothetical protein ABEI13_01150 [Candidatus Paceibacteria bacterium]